MNQLTDENGSEYSQRIMDATILHVDVSCNIDIIIASSRRGTESAEYVQPLVVQEVTACGEFRTRYCDIVELVVVSFTAYSNNRIAHKAARRIYSHSD